MSSYKILVGSYTSNVSTLLFSPSSSPPTIKILASKTVGHHPSWIAQHPTDKHVFFATLEQTEGQIAVLRFDGEEGGVEVVSKVDSGGADPAHCLALDGEVVVGNYSGHTLSFLPYTSSPPHLTSTSSPPLTSIITLTGSGPNTTRQECSHPHQVYQHPTRPNELLVPDLGADKVWRLIKNEEGGEGKWEVKGAIDYEPGSGPRHVIVVDSTLYTVLELTSTLTAHFLPPLPSPPQLLTSLPTLSHTPTPGSSTPTLAAEILHDPLTSTLLISNRNEPTENGGDTIAIFPLPLSPSTTKFLKTPLKHLRSISLSPDLEYLIVGGTESGGVVVYGRSDEETGWKEVAREMGVEKPTGLVWI